MTNIAATHVKLTVVATTSAAHVSACSRTFPHLHGGAPACGASASSRGVCAADSSSDSLTSAGPALAPDTAASCSPAAAMGTLMKD